MNHMADAAALPKKVKAKTTESQHNNHKYIRQLTFGWHNKIQLKTKENNVYDLPAPTRKGGQQQLCLCLCFWAKGLPQLALPLHASIVLSYVNSTVCVHKVPPMSLCIYVWRFNVCILADACHKQLLGRRLLMSYGRQNNNFFWLRLHIAQAAESCSTFQLTLAPERSRIKCRHKSSNSPTRKHCPVSWPTAIASQMPTDAFSFVQ